MKIAEIKDVLEKLRKDMTKRDNTPEELKKIEALEAAERTVGLCLSCRGNGVLLRHYAKGNGFLERQLASGIKVYQYVCEFCKGAGQIVTDNCSSCGSSYFTRAEYPHRLDGADVLPHDVCDECLGKMEKRHGVVPLPVTPEVRKSEPKAREPEKVSSKKK